MLTAVLLSPTLLAAAPRADACLPALQKKINLSKTVRKTPVSSDLSQKGSYMRDESIPMPQYDEARSMLSVTRSSAAFAGASMPCGVGHVAGGAGNTQLQCSCPCSRAAQQQQESSADAPQSA